MQSLSLSHKVMNEYMKQLILFICTGLIINNSMAQAQLPDFSVYKVGGGRVVIAWTHNYPVVKQISIQRSYNKTNYYKTIVTIPDPDLQENGFADQTAPNDSMYYRIFIMWDQGRFTTSEAKRPGVDSLGLADSYRTSAKPVTELNTNFLPSGFTPSQYIFTSPDRYVRVELPFDNKKYDIKFFSENYQPLFELNNIKERRFKLDRSYFYTAGYINFEIYADGKLFEKYKLFVPKEF